MHEYREDIAKCLTVVDEKYPLPLRADHGWYYTYRTQWIRVYFSTLLNAKKNPAAVLTFHNATREKRGVSGNVLNVSYST